MQSSRSRLIASTKGRTPWVDGLFFLLWDQAARAQGTSPPSDLQPSLLPPHGEFPPGFWEQHGLTLLVAAMALPLLVFVIVRAWLRTKPAKLSPEIQAREALQALARLPENGAVLMEVSQIVRRYLATAFHLPAGELTTTELQEALSKHANPGEQLLLSTRELLRQCDERKFAPERTAAPLHAARRALELLALVESCRTPAKEESRTL